MKRNLEIASYIGKGKELGAKSNSIIRVPHVTLIRMVPSCVLGELVTHVEFLGGPCTWPYSVRQLSLTSKFSLGLDRMRYGERYGLVADAERTVQAFC